MIPLLLNCSAIDGGPADFNAVDDDDVDRDCDDETITTA